MKQSRPLNVFPIFSVLDTSVCRTLIREGKVREVSVKAAEQIEGNSIFCVLEGTAAVYAKNEAHPALIRYLKAGDIFGAAAVHATDPHLSTIRSQTAMTMLEVPRETIDLLLERFPAFTESYLSFLSDRIAFLNKRIALVTAGSAEQRLAGWLTAVSGENSALVLPVTMSSLAKLLDLGRASLYRAFDVLEEKNLIERDGDTVLIRDRAALKALV